MRTSAAFAIAFGAALAATPALAQFKTPQETVRAVYKSYEGRNAKGFLRDHSVARRFFTPDLAKMWLTARHIDADFFVQGQDFELGPVTITRVAGVNEKRKPVARRDPNDGPKAAVVAEFTNFKKPMRLTYEMVSGPDGWRITDVKSDTDSFRAMLRKSR